MGDRGTSGDSHSSRLGSSPPGSPPQVSAVVRAEEEREARCQQKARYKALAHLENQRRRQQAPLPEPKSFTSWRWR